MIIRLANVISVSSKDLVCSNVAVEYYGEDCFPSLFGVD